MANKITPTQISYTQAGIASFLPGMIRMHELMGQAIEEMRQQLTALQHPPPKRQYIRTAELTEEPLERLSMRGVVKGSAEWRRRDNHNKRVLRAQKAAIREGRVVKPSGRPRGRPPKMDSHQSGAMSWANMTAEERSREMIRRRAVAKAKRGIENLRNAARTRWDRMTRAQRQEWKNKMVAGRQKRLAEDRLVNGAA